MPQQDSSVISRSSRHGRHEPTVLVVEDNIELLDVIHSVFLRHGFRVQAAASVEEAVPYLAKNSPDIVLCDIMLPGKSGYDLYRELKVNPDWSDIPFIFLTALSSSDEIARGRLCGCDDYVTKPFDPEELLSIVRGRLSLVAHRRQMEELRLDRYRKRVLNTLSHEFKTPLVAIKAGTELLSDRQELQIPELRLLLDSIQRGGERLERLVNNFLLLQQVEVGHAEQSCERFRRKLSPLLLAEMALDSFRGGGIEFRHGLNDDSFDIAINVYDVHVVHALHHLLSNAVKFGAKSGPVRFMLSAEGSDAVFSVRDRGPGIAPDQQTRACEPFIQVDRENNEQQGAGLGLTVAKYFVEMNGGVLELCRPEDGIGLDARLRFPLA